MGALKAPLILFLHVSILVLVDLAFESPGSFTTNGSKISFNPCFSGSCIRMLPGSLRELSPNRVSILVLVDLAFEYGFKNFAEADEWLFQSLF